MRYEQLRAVFRSLRFRLTAWNTAVVLLTVLLALFGVREGLRLSLIDELEKSLVDDSVEVSLAVEQFYPDLDQVYKEMNRKVKGHEDRDLFVRIARPGRQGALVERQYAAAGSHRASLGQRSGAGRDRFPATAWRSAGSLKRACRRISCASVPR